ncbi:MAG: SPOR domain-containing protein [Gammaproteobacteria bacterium]|nr:SPOR domain-containing protein [Gammaproteobacteria bacterium]
MLGTKPRGATKRPTATAKRRGPLVPTWLWTVFGVLFGLTCLALLYLWQPWQPTSHESAAQTETSAPKTADGDKPAKFQFYDLLPKQEVTPIPTQTVPDVVPDDPSTPVVDAANSASSDSDSDTKSTQTKAAQTHYILQVNSFQSSDEADKQRASVLLAGLPADVRHTTSDGQDWYRVISGPFNSKSEAMKAQKQLQDSGIDALVVEQGN